MGEKAQPGSVTDLAQLHVTVISLAMDGLSLAQETEMAKAALLYADRVTIASPGASMLASFASLSIGDERQRMATLAQLTGALPGGDAALELATHLLSKKHLTRQELLALGQLRKSAHQLEELVEQKLHEAGAAELSLAIERGAVDIDLLGVDEMAEGDDLDVILDHVVGLMERMVTSSSTSHPLFDGTASSLLKAMVDEGHLGEVELGPAAEIRLASALIANMEAFPQASMDVVLDVRDRLRESLTRFRVAVDGMAREMRDTPLGPSFEAEARRLYRARVEPSLLEIRELIAEMGVRSTLARTTSTGLPPALISFLVGAGLGAPDWVKLGSIGGSALRTAAKEYLKRRQLTASAKSNEIYFLYAANTELRAD